MDAITLFYLKVDVSSINNRIKIKRYNNCYDRSDFEGSFLIFRLWERLSLQVGEIKARKFAMGPNMA
jgi:hypothetical protein